MHSSKYSRFLALLLFAGIVIGTLHFSKEVAAGIHQGILISMNTLIPSMFFFMAIAKILSEGTLIKKLPYPHCFEKLFHLDRELFSIFLLSLVGGYPVGAKLIGEEVINGRITQEEGQRMLPFSVNCSPAFLISGVSLSLWGKKLPGIILYLSQVMAALLLAITSGKGVIRRKFTPTNQISSLSIRLVAGVRAAANSMGVICIFVVLFCGIFPLLDLFPLSDTIQLLCKGLLEVTSGCQMITSKSLLSDIFLTGLFTSFGGICVHLQLTALLSESGIKMGTFLLSRICYTGLSLLFSIAGYFLWSVLSPEQVAACFLSSGQQHYEFYTVSPVSAILLGLLAAMLLLSRGKSVIIGEK